jgi:hypothetical protein
VPIVRLVSFVGPVVRMLVLPRNKRSRNVIAKRRKSSDSWH